MVTITGRFARTEPNIQDVNSFNEQLVELSPEVRTFVLQLLREFLDRPVPGEYGGFVPMNPYPDIY